MRGGAKAGSRVAVVYVATRPHNHTVTAPRGPRCGFVVSKAVGNAVTRHHVTRLLRHIFMNMAGELPTTMDVVIRALPPMATMTTAQLQHELGALIQRAATKAGFQLPPEPADGGAK